MRVTEDFCPVRDGKRLMIEWSGIELAKHRESRFEKTARILYEKTKSLSDMFNWLSEWAITDEELSHEKEKVE